MKKITLSFLLLLVLSVVGFGQKCKYDMDETDKFSGAVKKVIEKTMFTDSRLFGLSEKGFMQQTAIWFKITRAD